METKIVSRWPNILSERGKNGIVQCVIANENKDSIREMTKKRVRCHRVVRMQKEYVQAIGLGNGRSLLTVRTCFNSIMETNLVC